MTTKQIQALESYFKTENEHWNGYAFRMLCEIIQKEQFEDYEVPLQIFSDAIDIVTKQYETPLKAAQEFSNTLDEKNLTLIQRLFIYEWVNKYLRESEFGEVETTEIMALFKGHTKTLKSQLPDNSKPLTGNIRETLKGLIQQEMEQLPQTLKDLEPQQRLSVFCKLIPYVLPRVQAVHSEKGEPGIGISGFSG